MRRAQNLMNFLASLYTSTPETIQQALAILEHGMVAWEEQTKQHPSPELALLINSLHDTLSTPSAHDRTCFARSCSRDPTFPVAEIWFQDSAAGPKLASTERILDPMPRLCVHHKIPHAHDVAATWLARCFSLHLLDRTLPTSWHIRYADGDLLHGPISPQTAVALPYNLRHGGPP